MPKLTLKFKESVLKEYNVDKGTLTVGRAEDNDLVIENLAVSGHHARLVRENGDFVLIDLNSLNGTFVNGHKVSKWILKHNDLVTIGKHTIIFQDEQAGRKAMLASTHDMKAPEGTVMLDVQTKQQLLEEAATNKHAEKVINAVGVITFIAGGDGQGDIELSKRVTLIGKGNDADVKIKGFLLPKTSAVISRRSSGYFLSHSEGRAVPKVNGVSIRKGQFKLKEGDMIEIAGTSLQFYIKSTDD